MLMNGHDTTSHIADLSGVPTLFINGKPFPAAAYITYLDKYAEYEAFAKAGCRLFSVPLLFAGRWISATDGFRPFRKGFFDEKDKPDFSPFDEAVEKILSACPDAYIIPRLNVSMPEWWEKENPDSVNILSDGRTKRESFYSEKWKNDTAGMLEQFLAYVEDHPFSEHIAGWQIAGGNTEEWFHFDLNGGWCKNAEKGFERFFRERRPGEKYPGLPEIKKLDGKGVYLHDRTLKLFLEYANLAAAEAICFFAETVKKATKGRLAVGAFYGYSLEVTSPLHGTHALKRVLEDENVDFICSPNSYSGIRDFSHDWTEMYPASSVRLHGKMCFQECDIRTHLTVELGKKDPYTDPDGILKGPIWQGTATKDEARAKIKKSFARQLIRGNGLWWFDMWGGWYDDPDIMNDMEEYFGIYNESLLKEERSFPSEAAVFTDETAYRTVKKHRFRETGRGLLISLGKTGVPYDIYDLFDFEAVHEKYKAVVFLTGIKTPGLKKAMKLCRKNGIPFIVPSRMKTNYTSAELRSFFRKNGLKIYCDSDDILYISGNYAALCALTDGDKKITVPGSGTVIEKHMKRGETELFIL